jgi:transcriptional regulator with XRE-family HTH domain
MSQFKDNLDHIIKCLEKLRGRRLSTSKLGEFFRVNRMTVYGWQKGNYVPKRPTLSHLAEILKSEFRWNITGDELIHTDITKTFDVFDLIHDRIEDVYIAYGNNVNEDLKEVGQRLRSLRINRGYTLEELSNTVRKLFPDDKTFQISHTHISEIERGIVKDYHVNRMRALATVLGVDIEYLLLNRKSNNKLGIDKERGLLTIPLNSQVINLPDKELKSFVLKIQEILKAIEPSLFKKPAIVNQQLNIIHLKR